jgi:hypothetical protein
MSTLSKDPTDRGLVSNSNTEVIHSPSPQYIFVMFHAKKTTSEHPYNIAMKKYAFRSQAAARQALLHSFDNEPDTNLNRVTPNPSGDWPEWEFALSVMKNGVYDGEIWMERLEIRERDVMMALG